MFFPAGPPKAHAEVLSRRRRQNTYGPNMRQRWRACREATASDSNSSKFHRREGQFAAVPQAKSLTSRSWWFMA